VRLREVRAYKTFERTHQASWRLGAMPAQGVEIVGAIAEPLSLFRPLVLSVFSYLIRSFLAVFKHLSTAADPQRVRSMRLKEILPGLTQFGQGLGLQISPPWWILRSTIVDLSRLIHSGYNFNGYGSNHEACFGVNENIIL